MEGFLGLIMIIWLVPTLIIMYFILYPKKWQDKKLIFGVRNRAEFLSAENEKIVDEIVARIRTLATWIIVISCVIAVFMLLIPDTTMMMVSYVIFILLALVAANLPFMKGNTELKSLKKEIGIASKKGTRSVDMKSISSSHALNYPMLLIPNLVVLIGFAFALFYDLNLISIGSNKLQGSFALTVFAGTVLFQGMLFVLIAILMDRMRNEVVSEKSDVNSNFNRAKKKIWGDTWVLISWVNVILLVLMLLSMMFFWSEMLFLIAYIVWFILIMALMAVLAKKMAVLKKSYKPDMIVEDDDDDYWIFGMFYYNPTDSRMNVEKRAGIGGTVNMAHPGGKAVIGIIALLIVGVFVSLFYVVLLEKTPLDVKVEDGKVICHQIRDDYKIPVDDIQEVTYVDSMKGFSAVKTAGTATDNVLKGRFSVEGEGAARLFMNPKEDAYIKIVADGKTYFINDTTKEDTLALYDQLAK